jgi:antitoxin ParD1/3/4
MATDTVSLPESLKEFADAQIARKGFGNVSEYVSSLLREAQEREADARLEALLLEGLASDPIPVDEEYWKSLKERTEAMVRCNDHCGRRSAKVAGEAAAR